MESIQSQTAETGAALASRVATGIQNGGAAMALFGGLSAVELAAFGGLFIAFIGYVSSTFITWYYKRKEDRRSEEEHRLRITIQTEEHLLGIRKTTQEGSS